MDSKYGSRCVNPACAEKIEIGDKIQFYGKGKVYHYDCRPLHLRAPEWRKYKQCGFIFNDLETGGLNEQPGVDEFGNQGPCGITQIAAIATSNNFVVQGMFNSHVRCEPGLLYLPDAMAIHGYSEADLAEHPSEKDAVGAFLEFCRPFKNYRFAGYNCPFDLRFLKAAMTRQQLKGDAWIEPALCLYLIAKESIAQELKVKPGLTDEQRKCKLTNVAEHLGIRNANAHNALVDLYMTVQVAREILIAEQEFLDNARYCQCAQGIPCQIQDSSEAK